MPHTALEEPYKAHRGLIPKASFFRSYAGGVPSGATEGSSMGAPRTHLFLLFRDHFLDPFSEHFFLIFGPQKGPKIDPKWSQNQFFFKLALGALFLGF